MDVDTDRASMGWTNWDLDRGEKVKVKSEQAVFKFLRPAPRHVIEVDTPSPAQKKRKSSSLPSTSSTPAPENPTHAMLGLPPADDEDSLEQALEEEMDHFFDTFPQVGIAPEDIE